MKRKAFLMSVHFSLTISCCCSWTATHGVPWACALQAVMGRERVWPLSGGFYAGAWQSLSLQVPSPWSLMVFVHIFTALQEWLSHSAAVLGNGRDSFLLTRVCSEENQECHTVVILYLFSYTDFGMVFY